MRCRLSWIRPMSVTAGCARRRPGACSPHGSALKDKLLWTKGDPSFFHSSNLATRGFCSACGTPLTFAYNDPRARFDVTMGSLDSPEAAPVTRQYGVESRIGWVRFCEHVPCAVTGEHDPSFFAGMEN